MRSPLDLPINRRGKGFKPLVCDPAGSILLGQINRTQLET